MSIVSLDTPIHISAVIPTYNRVNLIARAIESVLAQSYAAAEILVVDDGSVDDTGKVVKAYGERVRYLYQANAGVSAARNRGVREARYQWVAFLDSDDYWTTGHLARMVEAIEVTEGKASLYFSDLQLLGETGGCHYWQSCGMKSDQECEFKSDASDWAFMPVQPMMLQASVIRREAYLTLNGLPDDLRTREDTLLFYKLALSYPACAVPGCGTVMTSDDSVRLTRVYNSDSQVYQEATVRLLKNLLEDKIIRAQHKRSLKKRLSAAYFSMGRYMFRKRMLLRSMQNGAMACQMSPAEFLRELIGTLARHLPGARRTLTGEKIG